MLHKTDYGLVYNDDGSLCVTHQKDGAVAVEEGTTNLVPSNRLKFEGWTAYSGAQVTLTQNVEFPEIGRNDATRIRTTGGTSTLKYFRGIETSIAGQAYTGSVYIKNIGSKPVRFYTQFGPSVTVNPGEWTRAIASGVGNGTTNFQLRFQALNVDDDLDFIAWGPQAERKPFATSFVDGTRPDGILAYPIALKDDYTIACYRKSHTDEDYKHVVKRSDGKVFVDGVEDSEYNVGWIAGRNLVLNSATEHAFTNTIFNKPLRADVFHRMIGEQLTLSFYAKAEVAGQMMDCYLRNASAGVMVSGSRWGPIEISTEYTRYSYTIVLSDISDINNLGFGFRNTSEAGGSVRGGVSVKNIKIEKGSTATDWTPAPEDLGYDGDVLMLSNHTGHIKDLKILPYIATDKEIKQMYSGGTFGVTHKGIVIADNYSEVGPMNGIIAWWPLDGHTDDYSGNNNHATNNGATITSGIRGSAYNFDGSSSYIRANNVLSQGSPFSISFWTKVFGTSNQCLGCSRTATGNGMSIFIISNKIRFDTDHQWTTGYTVPRNEWIHVVLMQDTSGKKLYINGELEDSTSSVGSMSNLSSIFQIGASHSNGSSLGNYLNGVVSDYRIYNRALSPEEVKILYNATKPDPVPMQISNNGIVYLAGELKEV